MNNNLNEQWSLVLKYGDSKYFVGLMEDHTLTNMFRTWKMVTLFSPGQTEEYRVDGLVQNSWVQTNISFLIFIFLI